MRLTTSNFNGAFEIFVCISEDRDSEKTHFGRVLWWALHQGW